MSKSLAHKVAIVSGAATGIGLESARVLGEQGATVVLADINAPGIEKAAATLVAEGLDAHPISFDITVESQIAEAIAKIVKQHGRIDIIHNNAAIQTEAQRAKDLDVIHLDAGAWDAAMAVNVRGPMLLCKHALPVMIANGGGSVIHSSSGFGTLGETTLTAYGSSKAALINLSRFIATQYGKQNVRSNVIVIGFVLTQNAQETTPQIVKDILLKHVLANAHGTPRNIADVVAFLASDKASFINGAMIPVDGGFTAHQASYAHFAELFESVGSSKL
jgi:NAD(P)-dependent dehydrogenase (short-subunit alcohol dehydrogenase family)